MKTASPTRPLLLLLFVVFSGVILGDTASEALLLANFPASVLPNMFLVNSLFLFVIAMFLITIIDQLDRGKFFLLMLGTHCGLILCLRLLAASDFRLMYPVLFSYSYVTKILIFLLFWTIANDICDARKAKELFPKIAAGGVVGGLGISFSISLMVKVISPANLLILWAFLNGIAIFAFLPIHRMFRAELRGKPPSEKEEQGLSLRRDFGVVMGEPLLRTMGALYFLVFFLLLNQDFQFYSILRETFLKFPQEGKPLATQLSSFLGLFRGISTTVTFFLQLTVAGLFLRKLGTAKSMYLLPAVFTVIFGFLFLQSTFGIVPDGALGSVTSPFSISLFALILTGVGLRIAFFDSIFSPNFQIFFSSLPKEIRGRGKIFIEGVIKPFAISLAGLFMLFVAGRISRQAVFFLLTVVSLGLLALTARLRKIYTDSIARYLGGLKSQRLSSILHIRPEQAGESLLAVLAEGLRGNDNELKAFAVEMLCRFNTEESVATLTEEYEKSDVDAKAMILAAMAGLRRQELLPLFQNGLLDDSEEVIANSILAISKLNPPEGTQLILPYLFYQSSSVRANAVIALWDKPEAAAREKLLKILRKMVASESEGDIAKALYAMGVIGEEEFIPFFEEMGPKPSAQQVFLQWATALGSIQSPKAVHLLLSSLPWAGRNETGLIQRSLEAIGPGFPEEMVVGLEQPDWQARRLILQTIQRTGLKRERKVLEAVRKAGLEMASDTHRLLEILRQLVAREKEEAVRFLASVLQEEWVDRAKECLILVAGILDPTDKIALVGKKLLHQDAHLRANAIEALENLGDPYVNRLIVPLFERAKTKLSSLPPGKTWGNVPDNLHGFAECVLVLPSKWIRSCCVFAVYKLYLARSDKRFLKILGTNADSLTEDTRKQLEAFA